MKRIIFPILSAILFSVIILIAPSAAAQNSAPDTEAYNLPDVLPEYPGGEAAIMERISEVVKYPADAYSKGVQGRVMVRIVVDKNGKVTEPSIVSSVSPELDREAVNAVMQLADFTPGMVGGNPVNVYYTIPIVFQIKEKAKNADTYSNPVLKRKGINISEMLAAPESRRPNLIINGVSVPLEKIKEIAPESIEAVATVTNKKNPYGLIMITTKSTK